MSATKFVTDLAHKQESKIYIHRSIHEIEGIQRIGPTSGRLVCLIIHLMVNWPFVSDESITRSTTVVSSSSPR